MDRSHTFGQWLKQRRKSLDVTQFALAERVGCAEATIYKIEADTRRPSHEMAALLAEALIIPPAERPAFLRAARTGCAPATPPGLDPTPRAAPTDTPRLAVPLTPLIGREGVLAAVRDLLASGEVRLCTLTGAPGIGKTRIALALAAAPPGDPVDGVLFVPLATITDPALVGPTIARAAGLEDHGGRSLSDRLAQYVQAKDLLLVLDNFEQVLDAAPLVAHLLRAGPGLRVLVTSREALHIDGEQQFAVPPLALPDATSVPTLEELARNPAVALFVARARAVQPAFMLNAATAPSVAAICAHLDGLPLAIELAAARTKLLTLPEILARVDRRLGLLTGGARHLPARQQTLGNAIRWSYDLLLPAEQKLFARLGVFVGGGTVESIEAVCTGTAGLALPILDGLASLLDKSLLRQEAQPDGVSRFTMLETIREYARERLEAEPDAAAVRQAHAAYYLALAEAAAPALHGPEQVAWLVRLEAEHDNLRAALATLTGEAALRLAGALGWFWEVRGHIREGRARLTDLLAQPAAAAPTPARAAALNAAGRLAYRQGDGAAAVSLLEASLTLARQTGADEVTAHALHNLGNAHQDFQNDPARARACYAESQAIGRRLGDGWIVAWAVIGLGWVALAEGDLSTAGAAFDESLSIRRELGDQWGIARSLRELGMVAQQQGDYSRARVLYEESLLRHRALGNRGFLSFVLPLLGQVARLQGDQARTAEIFRESLALAEDEGDQPGMVLCLTELARAVVALGRGTQAGRWLGTVAGALVTLELAAAAPEHAAYAAAVAEVRAALEPGTFAVAWEAGRATPLAIIVAEALGRRGQGSLAQMAE